MIQKSINITRDSNKCNKLTTYASPLIRGVRGVRGVKKALFEVFNPLNPPYQGDFKRKCVSPETFQLTKKANNYKI